MKRFVGWGTDLRNKYWNDIFFRTEFNVIALQILFAIVLSVLVALFFNYLYKDILNTIVSGITQSLKNNGSITGKELVNSINIIRAKNLASFFVIALSITFIFSYIIAKMTLSPARSALNSQKRFVSDIAHELRTPLSVIKTNIEVALLDESVDNKTKKIFKSTIEELDRASSIINNLLTFNTLVHPEHIQFNDVNMSLVLDNAMKKLDDLARKKEIKLTTKKISPYSVWGNMTALEQIVTNIIKNAINYTPENGSITISLEPDYQGNIIFSVSDTGIGISQEDLKHIFEPFYRAEKSRNRQSGSSGLGLTIVSELVKLHSGKISVRSQLKRGTTVSVILPYNKDVQNLNHNKPLDEVSIDFLKKK